MAHTFADEHNFNQLFAKAGRAGPPRFWACVCW
jgi:hypothetical protein